jgi:thiol-disulfide isomerase/thioredoxin
LLIFGDEQMFHLDIATTRNGTAVFGLALARVVVALGLVAGTMNGAATADIKSIELIDGRGRSSPLNEILPNAPTILHLWATWCAPCRKELPSVARFADQLARMGQRSRLVVISTDKGSFERVARFLSDLGLDSLETWQAQGGNLGNTLQVLAYPSTVFLDGEGEIMELRTGSLDWDDDRVRARLFDHLGITAANH